MSGKCQGRELSPQMSTVLTHLVKAAKQAIVSKLNLTKLRITHINRYLGYSTTETIKLKNG
ncbi:hypothetical protein GGR94_003295 [Sulfitobacter geojensis]|nr:hypothetical protein [Sulfitobacter geojensis]